MSPKRSKERKEKPLDQPRRVINTIAEEGLPPLCEKGTYGRSGGSPKSRPLHKGQEKSQRGDELELNRRTNNDNQVKPIEDMSTLQLSPNEEPALAKNKVGLEELRLKRMVISDESLELLSVYPTGSQRSSCSQ
ncbi:hypothetical protein JHK85_050658 [Glycine max]|nr:hypothetical protein JHK85_050658 [Glycine max]